MTAARNAKLAAKLQPSATVAVMEPESTEALQRLPSALEFMLTKVDANIIESKHKAIEWANYGPFADDRTQAIYDEWTGLRRKQQRLEFSLDRAVLQQGIKPSEFVGMVVAGMSSARIDYEAIIKAQELPELLQRSFRFARKEKHFQERHEHLKAAGHHLAPKQAQIMIDQRDQRIQVADIGGLPSFEATLKGVEEIGQRRLPASIAQAVEIAGSPAMEEPVYAEAGQRAGAQTDHTGAG